DGIYEHEQTLTLKSHRSILPPPEPRRSRWRTRRRPADRVPARDRRRAAQSRDPATRCRGAPDAPPARRGRRAPRRAAPPAAPHAGRAVARRARRAPAPWSFAQNSSNNRGRLGTRRGEQRHVSHAGRREMWTPAALPAGCGRESIGDVARFYTLRDQIIGDSHVDAGPVARRKQHRNSALMLGTEAVHDRGNLPAILESGLADVQLHVSNLFDRALLPAPGALLEQLPDPLFELPILLEQRFDSAGEVLGLRLEQAGRLRQPLLQLERVAVCRGTGEGFEAGHAARRAWP